MQVQMLIRLFALLFLLAATALAQTKNTETDAAARALKAQKPYLIGISVASVDESVKWYEEKLGFKVYKRVELPQYEIRIAFLESNGFRIELVENKKSFSIKKHVPDYDRMAGLLQGVAKFAFFVEDIEAVAKALKARGVAFDVDLRESKEFGVKFFIISDNSGNLIQYFGF